MIVTIALAVLLQGGQGTQLGSQIADLGSGNSEMALALHRANDAGSALCSLSVPPGLSKVAWWQESPVAPELVATKGEWIQKPTSLKKLRGKVVLVDFWAYSCVNCIRTFPYLTQWYKCYHDKGFEIVAIHRPEFDFEAQPKNVAAATKRFGFTFPVLNDADSTNWNNYGITAWPTKIIVDPNGKIVYRHEGEGSYDLIEKQIQAQLVKANPKLTFNGIMAPVRPTDAPGARCQAASLESFAASTRFADFRKDQRYKRIHFTYPARRFPGFNFSGDWTPMRVYVEEHGNAAFKFAYMGKDANSVLHAASGPVTAELWQDGKPLPANAVGDDVKMIKGVPTLKIDEPRMYSVIRNPEWGLHEMEIRFKQPGARLYTLTFGTDCRPLPRRKR